MHISLVYENSGSFKRVNAVHGISYGCFPLGSVKLAIAVNITKLLTVWGSIWQSNPAHNSLRQYMVV